MAQRYEGHLKVYRPELQNYLTPIFRGYSTSLSPLCKRLGSLLDTRGRYNPETLSAVHDLALECDRLGKEEEARLLFLEAFDGRTRGLGMNDLDTLESAYRFALILDRQMKYEDAMKWYKQVFLHRLDVLGKDDPDTMTVGHQYASVCEKLGKYGEAKDYFLKVFFVRSDKLGNDHPDTLTTAHHLGSVCEKLRRYDDSYKWYIMVLNNRLKVLGKRDKDTRDTYHRLLSLCTQKDDKQGREAVEKTWTEAPESVTAKKKTTQTFTISEVLEFEDGQKLSTTNVKFERELIQGDKKQTMSTSFQTSVPIREIHHLFDAHSEDHSIATITATDTWFDKYKEFLERYIDVLDHGDKEPKRVKVAILDTGIDLTNMHIKDREDRIKAKRNFVSPNSGDVQDINGHGTHIAGTILEVAPESELYIGRITESKELSDTTSVVEAIKWAVDCEVDIINLSFGFDSPQRDIDEAIDAAFRKNIIMFAATANHGAQQRMSWPARDPRVICVHSSDGYGCASAFTAKPEDSGCKNFAIVGDAINSHWIQENNTDHAKHHEMRRMSGTSFATPVLAGFAATILHYVRVKLTDMDARLAAKAETLYGMLHILSHDKLCNTSKSPNYVAIMPWSLWEKPTVDQELLEALDG